MYSGIFFTSPISKSMFSAASLAPPCKGPHKEVKPVDIDANGFTPDDAANLTVDVDAFCS